MTESVKEKVVAELAANPSRLAVVAEKLGVSYDTVYKIAIESPELTVIGKQQLGRGRPISIYGRVGSVPKFIPPPPKLKIESAPPCIRYPRKVCLATETAAKVAIDVKRVFGILGRTKPLIAFVSKGAVFVTTPETFDRVASREWIGTYAPSATRRDIYEDYAHHLEGRAAA